MRAKRKDSAKNTAKNSERTKLVNTEKVSPVTERSGAEDIPSTNSRKRRRSDKENPDNWIIKKCKVSINDVKKRTGIHIKLRHGEEQPRVNISVHVDF